MWWKAELLQAAATWNVIPAEIQAVLEPESLDPASAGVPKGEQRVLFQGWRWLIRGMKTRKQLCSVARTFRLWERAKTLTGGGIEGRGLGDASLQGARS